MRAMVEIWVVLARATGESEATAIEAFDREEDAERKKNTLDDSWHDKVVSRCWLDCDI